MTDRCCIHCSHFHESTCDTCPICHVIPLNMDNRIFTMIEREDGSISDHCEQYSDSEHARLAFNVMLANAQMDNYTGDNRTVKGSLKILSATSFRYFRKSVSNDRSSSTFTVTLGV